MDPIADLLNRIKNAQAASHQVVRVPFSKMKFEIAKILEREGFIESVDRRGKGPQKIIRIFLKYKEDGKGALSDFKMISKPSRRVYIKAKEIKKTKGGYGISIISTPKGIMTDKEAKKNKVGGEIICEVW